MLKNPSPDIPFEGIDTSLLASLIIELNTANRFFKAYPSGHPVVITSLHKVVSRYTQLLGSLEEVKIAVAKDALFVGNDFLDKGNRVFRDFAGTLFEKGIGALILQQGLTIEELTAFYSILGLSREEIAQQGGIELIWGNAHLTALGMQAIRYDLFGGIEGDNHGAGQPIEGLWERFARGLIEGTLGQGLFEDICFKPQLVADALNKRYQETGGNYLDDFSAMLQQEENQPLPHRSGKIPYKQIAAFAAHLSPGLRQHFLSETFNITTLEGNSAAEEIISCMLPQKAVETLEELKRSDNTAPAPLIKLLEKLANRADAGHPDAILLQDPSTEKMRLIFSEHGVEEHMATENSRTSRASALNENQYAPDRSGRDILISSLDPHLLENQIGEIILRLATSGNDPAVTENLAHNLGEMCTFLLQTGDYHQLQKIIGRAADPTLPASFRARLTERFSQRTFLDEILNGLAIWGKTRYYDIRQLIEEIGAPFIEPLLDKLATEENMSLRRFIMDRIQEFGLLAKEPILSRMSDNRWYYLRNLLIMLHSYNDPKLAPHFRPFLTHTNGKVRQDALLCLLHYHDPAAERQLLRDLESTVTETKLMAIGAAKKSRSNVVFKVLLEIVSKSGFSPLDLEFRTAALHTLKDMGRIEALPVLTRILDSSNLLRSKALNRLKIEVVRSLEAYPPEAVLPILQSHSRGHDELALQVNESERTIRIKHNEH